MTLLRNLAQLLAQYATVVVMSIAIGMAIGWAQATMYYSAHGLGPARFLSRLRQAKIDRRIARRIP